MKYSLMIGRFQPFHDGHEALVRLVLNEKRDQKTNEKKRVCIAIRSTMQDEENPYSIEQRMRMIQDRFSKEIFDRQVVVSVIPDIEEVVWGRGVGYGRREIKLDKTTEEISATKIRDGHDAPKKDKG